MRIQTFSTAPAFVAIDLADGPATGIVRHAKKVLEGGAIDLARSLTYTYACLQLEVGGASAGINSEPDGRDQAVAAFVTELSSLESRWLHADAGKGVNESELAGLRSGDPRHPGARDNRQAIVTAGVLSAIQRCTGSLEGRTVACDAPWATVILDAVVAAGATVLHVDDPYSADAHILLTGAKVGAIDHTVAERINADVVCPIGQLPVTAKAFAALKRSGAIVLPDFVTLAALPAAEFADHAVASTDLATYGSNAVAAILDDVLDHSDGPYLGACYRAEAFLRTWQSDLPFGRPFAA